MMSTFGWWEDAKECLTHFSNMVFISDSTLCIEETPPNVFSQHAIDCSFFRMELREAELGPEDSEGVLVSLSVAVMFEVFPGTKQPNEIIQSTILKMKHLLVHMYTQAIRW